MFVLDDEKIAILGRSIVTELDRAAAHGAASGGQSPRGGTHTLFSDGISIPNSDQASIVCELAQTVPRSWIISMRGSLTAPLPFPPPFQFPLAKWRVDWGQQASSLSTELDGFSDQYLTVYGNFVRVTASWDLEAIARVNALFAPTFQPKALRMTASIAPSEGGIAAGRRSFAVIPSVVPGINQFPIPTGATGAIMRDPSTGNVLLPVSTFNWLASIGAGGTITDQWTGATLVNLHTQGRYGAIPSLADAIDVATPPTPGGNIAFLELELRP